MTAVSGFIVISLIISLLFMFGFLNLLTNPDENRCEMTFMFEYPQFVKMYVPQNEQFRRYKLYAYSEGRFTEQTREMKFTGVPVLYVPGNGGSFKQARSLASVALRKSLSSRFGFHLDFFTVDLNEELSGLTGSVLPSQIQFVQHCLYRILELYKTRYRYPKPESVIIIGHSMGGLIAQSILSNSSHAHLTNLLITLSSPHVRPSLLLDYNILKFFEYLENVTIEGSEKKLMSASDQTSVLKPYLRNKTIITIGGGHNDRLVNSMLTNYKFSTIHVLTDSIPTVWLSTDHACIVWCKQLVLTLIRALFDVIDPQTKQLSTDPEFRKQIFSYYLVNNNGIKPFFQNRYKETTLINPAGEWIEKPNRQKSMKFEKGVSQTKWLMTRLMPGEFLYRHLFIQAINLENTDWVFACAANHIRGSSRVCDKAIRLSHLSRIVPSRFMKRKILSVDLEALHALYPSVTHVVAQVLPTSDPVQIDMDTYDPTLREVNVTLPSWYSLTRSVIITETVQSALFYRLRLRGLDQLYQAYLLYVEVKTCSQPLYHSTANFSVPWAKHDTHAFFTEKEKNPMHIRLHSPKPLSYHNESALLELTLDPACRYTVSLRSSVIDSLTQIVKHYSPMLIANVGAALLLALRWQLISTSKNSDGYCPPLHTALASATKPYYLVTMAKLVGKVLSWKPLLMIGLARPDLTLLSETNMDFLLLPIALYAAAVGFLYAISVTLWVAVLFSGSAVHKLALRFLARTIAGTINWSDWLLTALHRVPSIVAVSFVALIFSTCGALGLVVGAVFYFLKLTKMYEDYLEELVIRSVKTVAKKIGKVMHNAISSSPKKNLNAELNETPNSKNKTDTTKETETDKFHYKTLNKDELNESARIIEDLNDNPDEESIMEGIEIINKEHLEENVKLKIEKVEESEKTSEADKIEETEKSSETDKIEKSDKTSETDKIEESEKIAQTAKIKETEKSAESYKIEEAGKITEPDKTEETEKRAETDKSEETNDRPETEKILSTENILPTKNTLENKTIQRNENLPDTENILETEISNDNTINSHREIDLVDDKLIGINNSPCSETSNDSSDKNKLNSKSSSSCLSMMHFHFTGFLIWLLITCLNIPSVLTWARNFKFESVLQPDPSFLPGFIMCTCAGLLWQIDAPKYNLKYYKELGTLLYLLAMINLLYTPISLYRLSYTMIIGIVLVTLHQILAPIENFESNTETLEDEESVSEDFQHNFADNEMEESTETTNNIETDNFTMENTESVEDLVKKKDLMKSKLE